MMPTLIDSCFGGFFLELVYESAMYILEPELATDLYETYSGKQPKSIIKTTNLRTFAPIASAHPYCARYSCRTRAPRRASSARAENGTGQI